MQDSQEQDLDFTVVPKDLKSGDVCLHSLWARRHGTKYNGAPYIIQRAGEAVLFSEAGKAQLKEQVAYYMNNAKIIKEGLKRRRIYCIWRSKRTIYLVTDYQTRMTSWDFFDYLIK